MTQPQPKPYNIKRCRPLYAIFKAVIMRPSYHKPKKISMLCDIDEPAIFVSNHDAKRSPVMADLYFPVKTVKWAHIRCCAAITPEGSTCATHFT